jgi:capsular exopolysaccharide synthesis family protein
MSTSSNEAIRILRSNLLVAILDLANPIVVVTSARASEGKTSVCSELARSLSLAKLKVVLVDMDLRSPDTHRWIGGHNEYGVAEILLEKRSLQDSLQYIDTGREEAVEGAGLYFLATGNGITNPTEMLATTRTSKMLKSLAAQADIVLLDTPPILPVADTLVIGRMAAGALMVVEAGSTPIHAVRDAKDALTRNQTRLLGIVLNKVEEGRLTYGYGYGDLEAAGPRERGLLNAG